MDTNNQSKPVYIYEIEVCQTIVTVLERLLLIEFLLVGLTVFVIVLEQLLLQEFIAQDGNVYIALVVLTTFLMNIFNIFIIISVHLKWASNYYVLRSGEVVFRKGLFNTSEERFSVENAVSISTSRSLLGKIFNFGTVKIFNSALGNDLILRDIPKPEFYAEILRRSKDVQNNIFMLNPRR
ncbi:MAG: Bacterial membrane flanked domain protein [candidate division WS6 bacterium OLB20]|uniref:Bacterial membrane flanked domain protein n=1 Tax=candidate division WS6 bacterium OLB20 TaxID=1617426 RepID=A0A136LX72_9BACT|nr:MAG: Bacterial membrane flanked domain protein [candidate division WS6 bacterium OLB20]